jgi:hypothetical protein
MEAATIRAMLEQGSEHTGSGPDQAHAMYTEDAVLEFPRNPASSLPESRT